MCPSPLVRFSHVQSQELLLSQVLVDCYGQYESLHYTVASIVVNIVLVISKGRDDSDEGNSAGRFVSLLFSIWRLFPPTFSR